MLAGNYRPISVISNLGKIFEKSVKDRINNFFQINNIININQYGFKEGMSTVDAIYSLMNRITENLDNGNVCMTVFLDLAKAFDTVSHDILLDVLERYGVRGTVLALFRGYLSERIQYVKIGSTLSDPKRVQVGVPQGTVLGPILFNIYLNSLFQLSGDGTIIAYADDSALFFAGTSWEEVRGRMIATLQKVKNFFDTFKLSLNVEKTNYMAFSITEAKKPNFNCIEIDTFEKPIKEVQSTKYLGIIIDNHLKWEAHISYLCKKTRYLIFKFYQLRDILNRKLMIMIYKALFEQIVSYGLVIWGGLYNSALEPLNVTQNGILRVIYKKQRLCSTTLLYSKTIFNIRCLYVALSCGFVYQNTKKKFVNNPYDSRSQKNKQLIFPSSKRKFNQRFIDYLGPKLYNNLALSIRNASSVKLFKIKCKDYIYENTNSFLKYF